MLLSEEQEDVGEVDVAAAVVVDIRPFLGSKTKHATWSTTVERDREVTRTLLPGAEMGKKVPASLEYFFSPVERMNSVEWASGNGYQRSSR